jgi:SAM-dependent methyltransferase
MRGLEIGPLASPRVHKHEGPVRYLDHASAEELRAKYGADYGMRNRLDDIVDVDYVIGKDMTLSDAVVHDAPFDYVIASHVIEHIPDPIDWMEDIGRILRPGGILSLIIPDKRYCFDINRTLTETSDLVDAYLRRLRQPSFRQVYDFESRAILDMVDTVAVWSRTADYSAVVRQDVADPDVAALDRCRRMQTSDEFVDVHCHVFTPDSFIGLFEKLARLRLIHYEVAAFVPTEANTLEFYVSLRWLDPSTSSETLLQQQLASVARARTPSEPPRRRVPLVEMEVSELEQKLLKAKRRALSRLRATMRRGT